MLTENKKMNLCNLKSLEFTIQVEKGLLNEKSIFHYESKCPFQVEKNIEVDLNKVKKAIRSIIEKNLKHEYMLDIDIRTEIKTESTPEYNLRFEEIQGFAVYVGSKILKIFKLIQNSDYNIKCKFNYFEVDTFKKTIQKDLDFKIRYDNGGLGYDDNLSPQPYCENLSDDNYKKYVNASSSHSKDPNIKNRPSKHFKGLLTMEDFDIIEGYLKVCLTEIERMEIEYNKMKNNP